MPFTSSWALLISIGPFVPSGLIFGDAGESVRRLLCPLLEGGVVGISVSSFGGGETVRVGRNIREGDDGEPKGPCDWAKRRPAFKTGVLWVSATVSWFTELGSSETTVFEESVFTGKSRVSSWRVFTLPAKAIFKVVIFARTSSRAWGPEKRKTVIYNKKRNEKNIVEIISSLTNGGIAK